MSTSELAISDYTSIHTPVPLCCISKSSTLTYALTYRHPPQVEHYHNYFYYPYQPPVQPLPDNSTVGRIHSNENSRPFNSLGGPSKKDGVQTQCLPPQPQKVWSATPPPAPPSQPPAAVVKNLWTGFNPHQGPDTRPGVFMEMRLGWDGEWEEG